MNTLDEVIKALEMCTADNCVCLSGCPYSYLADGDDGCEYHAIPEMQKDALHYLKEYQRDCEDLVEAAKSLTKKEHEQALTDRNDPLTWDELQKMVGKPVWVEVYDPIDEKSGWHTTFWSLIEFINDEYICLRDNDGEQQCYQKKSTEWQAYRKETNV